MTDSDKHSDNKRGVKLTRLSETSTNPGSDPRSPERRYPMAGDESSIGGSLNTTASCAGVKEH